MNREPITHHPSPFASDNHGESSAAPPRMDVAADEDDLPSKFDIIAMSAREEFSRMLSAEDENHLCTILCDILTDLPKLSNPRNDFKVHRMLEKCHKNDSYKVKKNISYFDIRGRCADDAKKVFEELLTIRTPVIMKAIIGCKVHGVGEGKLKQAILDQLNGVENIEYRWENGGSVISLTLGGTDITDDDDEELDISDPRVVEMEPFFVKTLKEYRAIALECENLQLCTFVCDYLFGIQRPPNQIYDDKMSKRVLAGFEKCYKDDRDKCIEDTNRVDLRGWSMMQAIEKLVKYLNIWSIRTPQGSLDVIVGCKLHGIGEGNLKKGIIAVLTAQENIPLKKDTHLWIITITFDGEKDYSSLIEVADEFFRPLYHYDRVDFDSDGNDNDVDGNIDGDHDDYNDYDVDVDELLAEMEAEMKARDEEEVLEVSRVKDHNEGFLVEEDEDGFPYIVYCDLQFGFPRSPDHSWDEKISRRVFARLEKGERGDSDKTIEGGSRVELCGRSVNDVLKSLAVCMDGWARSPVPWCKDFIVNCKLHGFGDERLKQAIIEWLNRDKGYLVEAEDDGGSVVSINFE